MIGWMLLAAIVAWGLSALVVAAIRLISHRIGYVDRPGGHKQHERPVALGGGIAIAAVTLIFLAGGVTFAQVFHENPPDWLPGALAVHLDGMASKCNEVLALVAGAIVLHVLGLIDDHRPLGPAVKFAVQFMVAIFIAGPVGIRLAEFLGPIPSIALTTIWIVLITNAFNFLDNMDGLSAGVAAIVAAILGVTAFLAGQIFVPAMAFVLAGTLLGYLLFNFPPASIFMGDAGSLVIGYLLSLLTILTTYYDPRQGTTPFGLLVPLVALAVPLYDVVSVVVHRIRAGESPLRGDRRHFSHRLRRRGLSTRASVLTIYLATAATGLPAILLPHLGWGMGLLIVAQCLCTIAIIAILEHIGASTPLQE